MLSACVCPSVLRVRPQVAGDTALLDAIHVGVEREVPRRPVRRCQVFKREPRMKTFHRGETGNGRDRRNAEKHR